MRKPFVRALCLALMLVCAVSAALADKDIPYDTYNYDYWNNTVFTPAAYVPDGAISGATLSFNGEPVGAFRAPQDVCVAPDGDVYLADTGNNRVLVLDSSMMTVKQIITSFERDGATETFSQPYGVAVSMSDQVYIADSQNHRIVVLNKDGSFVKTIENPQSEVLGAGFIFVPLKVAVDYADRVYCIAQKMFEGIMVFESAGNFTGFFGTINVQISAWEKFWRRLATKEERSKQQLFIPTEFTGIDIDDEGFVYASNVDTEGTQAVRRLNPAGQDVIRKGIHQKLGGDLFTNGTSLYAGVSKIVDVVYRGKGIYSLLDSRRGRIFSYDHEGNLLYIFGGLGTQEGTFTTPAAIEQVGERLVVLDSQQATLMVFKPTEYGSLINQAVALRFDGDETQAVELWERVLHLDENNELANAGIGKAYLSAGDNEKAMTYLKRGMNRGYYSVGYKRYRNEILRDNISWILTTVIVLVLAAVILKKWALPRWKTGRKGGGAA